MDHSLHSNILIFQYKLTLGCTQPHQPPKVQQSPSRDAFDSPGFEPPSRGGQFGEASGGRAMQSVT